MGWANPPIRLFHGTIERFASDIVAGGTQVRLGRARTDFGRGFYTTTDVRRARDWAVELVRRRYRREQPRVVRFEIGRDALAMLDSPIFVNGHAGALDYWEFVRHCREGAGDHARGPNRCYYDVVAGPVAASWRQRLIFQGVDQFSFHTRAGEDLLNASPRTILR